jgi:hypothetical protein
VLRIDPEGSKVMQKLGEFELWMGKYGNIIAIKIGFMLV